MLIPWFFAVTTRLLHTLRVLAFEYFVLRRNFSGKVTKWASKNKRFNELEISTEIKRMIVAKKYGYKISSNINSEW